MNGNPRFGWAASIITLVAALTLGAASTFAQPSPPRFKDRFLADALRALQARGLRIVFTSTIVTPELRVRIEPRAAKPRQQLDELLAPHGLQARDGPGGTIQIVRGGPAADAPPRRRATATGRIEGRVVHAFTNTPLSDVVLRLDSLAREVRTDATGRFLVRDVDAGEWVLRASATGFALVTRLIRVAGGTTATATFRLSPAAGTLSEYVTVSGEWPYRRDRGVASEASLDRSQFEQLHPGLADHPMRLVHALPRAAPVDDFRNEFAVRGSPFRHVEIVVDGVSTAWLQHAAQNRGATGSLAMLTGQVLEEATLRAGAYPRRYSDRLGAQLDLTLREGSRSNFKLRGTVGGTNATLVGEGPIGRSSRGSWLVAVRQSYMEWPTEQSKSSKAAFGFADGLAKVVYDLRPSQQVSLSVLGGMANVDGEDNPGPEQLGDGTNRASVVNLAWRSTFGSSVLSQRAYLVRHRFLNKEQSGHVSDRGTNQELLYRADVTRPIAGGVLEAGAQVGRTASGRTSPSSDSVAGEQLASVSGSRGSSWSRSGYAHFAWPVAPAFTLSPGLRVTDAGVVTDRTVSRWILSEWAFRPRWTLNASAGMSNQIPELRYLRDPRSSIDLRPERATHLDVAIEQRVTKSIRWQATVFTRREADVLREPDLHPRLVAEVLVDPAGSGYANALQGSSRGIELLVDRRSAAGLSGWAAYSYGRSRYTDVVRGETFWADFDQRHALNLFGEYRFANHASVGVTFRAGTNFPIPGYFAERDGGLFAADQRNEVRLPTYSRLDLRAARDFEYLGRRLTLFAEVLNVLDRTNLGVGNGTVRAPEGAAIGFTDTLSPRRVYAGILVEF